MVPHLGIVSLDHQLHQRFPLRCKPPLFAPLTLPANLERYRLWDLSPGLRPLLEGRLRVRLDPGRHRCADGVTVSEPNIWVA